MNVCVITDNEFIFGNFLKIIKDSPQHFEFFYSYTNKNFLEKYKGDTRFKPIRLKDENENFFAKYDLFISLHCKQIFPDNLVLNHRCINVHPGLNPYNRGWFPQVFSILNKKPIGVTIHEMDTELDHGPIIFQEELKIESYDTSYDIYCRLQDKEIEMIRKYLDVIVKGDYVKCPMTVDGNINYKSDFDDLCKLDLSQKATLGEVIDILRATTFAKCDNAYFIDEEGNKIYISVNLKCVGKND